MQLYTKSSAWEMRSLCGKRNVEGLDSAFFTPHQKTVLLLGFFFQFTGLCGIEIVKDFIWILSESLGVIFSLRIFAMWDFFKKFKKLSKFHFLLDNWQRFKEPCRFVYNHTKKLTLTVPLICFFPFIAKSILRKKISLHVIRCGF